jgi:hypothetical protein
MVPRMITQLLWHASSCRRPFLSAWLPMSSLSWPNSPSLLSLGRPIPRNGVFEGENHIHPQRQRQRSEDGPDHPLWRFRGHHPLDPFGARPAGQPDPHAGRRRNSQVCATATSDQLCFHLNSRCKRHPDHLLIVFTSPVHTSSLYTSLEHAPSTDGLLSQTKSRVI